MDKREALLGGPGLDGYAYQADCYCVACGQELIRTLPQDLFADSRGRDSDCVPQPIFFGEADTAQHCGECGEYMYGYEQDLPDTEYDRDVLDPTRAGGLFEPLE